jgi:hypothetical protein
MDFLLDAEDDEVFDDEDFDEDSDTEDEDADPDEEDDEEEEVWQVSSALTSQGEAPTLAPFSALRRSKC